MTGVRTGEIKDGQQRISDTLRRIKRAGGGPVSASVLARFATVSRPCARASVERLEELGKVARVGRNGWIWKEEET